MSFPYLPTSILFIMLIFSIDHRISREEYCCEEEPRLQGSFESIFFEFTSCYCKIFSITSLNFGFSPS